MDVAERKFQGVRCGMKAPGWAMLPIHRKRLVFELYIHPRLLHGREKKGAYCAFLCWKTFTSEALTCVCEPTSPGNLITNSPPCWRKDVRLMINESSEEQMKGKETRVNLYVKKQMVIKPSWVSASWDVPGTRCWPTFPITGQGICGKDIVLLPRVVLCFKIRNLRAKTQRAPNPVFPKLWAEWSHLWGPGWTLPALAGISLLNKLSAGSWAWAHLGTWLVQIRI